VCCNNLDGFVGESNAQKIFIALVLFLIIFAGGEKAMPVKYLFSILGPQI